MTSMVVRFRAPVGEELTDEHVERLEYAGLDQKDFCIERPGVICVELEFEEEDGDPDAMVETWAEDLLETLPDLEMMEYEQR